MPLTNWHCQSGVEEKPRNETFEDNNSAHDHSASRLESVSEKEVGGAASREVGSALSSVEVESDEIGQSSKISREEHSASVDVSEGKKHKKPSVTLSKSPGFCVLSCAR